MRHEKYKTIIDIFLYIILAISVVFAVIFYAKIDQLQVSQAPLNNFLYWSYFLLFLTIFFAFIIGPIVGFIQNPKSALMGLIALVGFAIIFGIAAALASPEPTPGVLVKASASAWKWADILLYSMYILGGLGFIAILFSELKALFH
jgi:hypothetical protein